MKKKTIEQNTMTPIPITILRLGLDSLITLYIDDEKHFKTMLERIGSHVH